MLPHFTVEDAFDSSEEGSPILLSRSKIAEVCCNHNADPEEYVRDTQEAGWDIHDAAQLLGWLGY